MVYKTLLNLGFKQEFARTVLPNSTATVIVITTNLREWRWIFKKRVAADAHPDIRALFTPLLIELREKIPVVFDDIRSADEQ